MGAVQACCEAEVRQKEQKLEDVDEAPPRSPEDVVVWEYFAEPGKSPAEAFADGAKWITMSIDALRQRLDQFEKELEKKARKDELNNKVADIWDSLHARGAATGCALPARDGSGWEHGLGAIACAPSGVVASQQPKKRTAEPGSKRHMPTLDDLADGPRPAAELERNMIVQQREIHRDEVQNDIRRRLRRFQRLGKSDTDGNEATNLTDEERNSIDEDCLMKEYAKEQICDCNSAREILMKAELLIDNDWLDKVDALPGNLFCLGAFGDIMPVGATLWSRETITAFSKYAGCLLIILIQILGPPLIFCSRMPGNIGIPDEEAFEWRCHPLVVGAVIESESACPSGKLPQDVHYLDDWGTVAATRFMGVVFILTFILNALFVVMDEWKTWKDLYNTFRFLDWKNAKFEAPGGVWLFFGAFVNCWVVVWSCLDMYVVVGASENPQDLFLDALGLLFLYRLDDVGGDLGFVDADDWPGRRLAWIYNELVHPWPDDEFDEDKLNCMGTLGMLWYRFVIGLICLLFFLIPAAVVITPFRDIAPA